MFQIGDSILLKDGTIRLISFKNDDRRVTVETAKKLYKKGEIIQKTIEINGQESMVDIEKALEMND